MFNKGQIEEKEKEEEKEGLKAIKLNKQIIK